MLRVFAAQPVLAAEIAAWFAVLYSDGSTAMTGDE